LQGRSRAAPQTPGRPIQTYIPRLISDRTGSKRGPLGPSRLRVRKGGDTNVADGYASRLDFLQLPPASPEENYTGYRHGAFGYYDGDEDAVGAQVGRDGQEVG
jgi:hypothetical protein